jgi:virginiamycin B lyase
VFEDGKIDRFDPKTETFKEFPLPNARSHPYALAIAPDHSLWYSSESRDVIGRLDPVSGKVTEYPMPYADNGMRDFFLDKDAHMWYGSPPNNRVGYFYLSTRQHNAAN